VKRRKPHPPPSALSGAVSDINITPMVDVLLCLLIFVIVIQPGLIKGVDLQVPPADSALAATTAASRDQLVLHVLPGPRYALNDVTVPAGELAAVLRDVFEPRRRKVLFVRGAEDARYEEVIAAVDLARSAGVTIVGLVPRD
jgi:biopolymer transport protein ExbD